jgi:hypothetical protein
MRRVLTLLLVPALLAGACAQDSEVDPWFVGVGAPASIGPDEVALRIESVDGFMMVEYGLTRVPELTIYGDGRVITTGPVIEIYPAPALPNVIVRTIDPATIDDLIYQALQAGVGGPADLGFPPIADAPSTRFTILTTDGYLKTNVYALGIDDTHGLSPQQRADRLRLTQFRDQLLSPSMAETPAPGDGPPERPYEPVALAAVTTPWVDPQVPGVDPQPERAWPGPALPGEPLGDWDHLRCVLVTAPELPAVLEAAATANVVTPWVFQDQRYQVWFRPLLPDESRCAALS